MLSVTQQRRRHSLRSGPSPSSPSASIHGLSMPDRPIPQSPIVFLDRLYDPCFGADPDEPKAFPANDSGQIRLGDSVD